jgi:hypothetical protein
MVVVPDAQTAADADPAVIEGIIQPLGFHRFRARAIVAMSTDYLRPWKRPSELRYIGKYASDAYWIFCRCGLDTSAGKHCNHCLLQHALSSRAYICSNPCTKGMILQDIPQCSSWKNRLAMGA